MKKIVELTIPAKLKDEPIIYTIYKKFEIIPNIIEASFSSANGWAIISFEGSEEELDRLFVYLQEKDIDLKFRDI